MHVGGQNSKFKLYGWGGYFTPHRAGQPTQRYKDHIKLEKSFLATGDTGAGIAAGAPSDGSGPDIEDVLRKILNSSADEDPFAAFDTYTGVEAVSASACASLVLPVAYYAQWRIMLNIRCYFPAMWPHLQTKTGSA